MVAARNLFGCSIRPSWPGGARWFARTLAYALSGIFLLTTLALGQRGPKAEYEVKAAFLLNFIRFTEWPEAKDPFDICIVGDDPFQGTLDRLVEGEKINGRQITVRRVPRWEESCRLLFISGSERDVFKLLRQAGPGVLTVGEEAGFLTDGGMINLVVDEHRVRFDVNLKAATSGSVRISSRLLSVARSVLR